LVLAGQVASAVQFTDRQTDRQSPRTNTHPYTHPYTNPSHHSGILLVLAGQVASAVQFVIEEKFLKDRNLHPLHVVGLEGVYGVILMIIVWVLLLHTAVLLR
jgi:hypothetical protein